MAALIALIAWAALVVQFFSTDAITHSVTATLWTIGAYFTILTNLLVALVFSCIAVERSRLRDAPVVAGTMLFILLVGIIYGLLLHGTAELSGGSAVANILLHMVTPVAVPIFWLLFTPKGRLAWFHPILWAIYPLLYLGYALLRGKATGSYPYPFLNVSALGWPQALWNILLIAVAFLLSAFALVWIDRRLAPAK